MRHRTVATILTFGLVALLAAPAAANLPDLTLSTASVDAAAACVFSIPDGSGQPLSAAMNSAGGPVDATITVTLLNPVGNPVVAFPLEDVWLESLDGNLQFCAQVNADADSDVSGMTTFSGALAVGGNTIVANGGGLKVMVLGSSLIGSDLALNVLTPDLDSNLVVGLSDTILFVPLYTGGGYDPSVDFYFDGVLNLSDLVQYASGLNTACP